MEKISWYIARLSAMSPKEVVWRVLSLALAMVESLRVRLNLIPQPKYKVDFKQFQPSFRVSSVEVGALLAGNGQEADEECWRRLIDSADQVLEHKISLFNLTGCYLGTPINWHFDNNLKVQCPNWPITKVNYRNPNVFGDCKLVWEPNRHHQLVILGRAYRLTGDHKYAKEVIDQIESWINDNPFGYGMNWRSPLELAIRLINWVWSIDMIFESGLVTDEFREKLFRVIYLHCRDISMKFSKGTSANNHLVGEAAGVYIASCYFDIFKESEDWRNSSRAILEQEIVSQSYMDGCTREHALGYQFFVIQFYLFSGMAAKNYGTDFSPSYWQRLEKLMWFIAKLAEGGESLPMFGDRDDGYVLNLGNEVSDINGLMGVARELFSEPIFFKLNSSFSETAFWLFGKTKQQQESEISNSVNALEPISSYEFEECGYYLLQYGGFKDSNNVSIFIDCAELGYTSIAAHGHADALSFAMRLGGQDLLVDTGTYDYFSYPEWRNYFRRTRAHNALEVDELDQSQILGPFLWGDHAEARCLDWKSSKNGGFLSAEHTGYQRLDNPATHARSYELAGDAKCLTIKDNIASNGVHNIKIYFHFSELCKLKSIENNVCLIDFDGREVQLILDGRSNVAVLNGSEAPIGGWLSRGYHKKIPIVTVVAQATINNSDNVVTQLRW